LYIRPSLPLRWFSLDGVRRTSSFLFCFRLDFHRSPRRSRRFALFINNNVADDERNRTFRRRERPNVLRRSPSANSTQTPKIDVKIGRSNRRVRFNR